MATSAYGRPSSWRAVYALAFRFLVFAGLWWGLSENDPVSWVVGMPAVLSATALSWRLQPTTRRRWRPIGVLLFCGYFIRESLRAGVDVARRAVSLDIAPEIIRYECTLLPGTRHSEPVEVNGAEPRNETPGATGPYPPPGAKSFDRSMAIFGGALSLLPGTLAVEIDGRSVLVHALDARRPLNEGLQRLERRVAALFVDADEGG